MPVAANAQWHLGSFYNDSEQLGGRTSSPITHGFDHMNATVEVAPTATTNCECKEEWYAGCDFGHDGGPSHCGGHGNPGGGPPLKPGCCFNYWWEDADSAHGVTNLTNPSPDNDANDYLATALVAFIETFPEGSDSHCTPKLTVVEVLQRVPLFSPGPPATCKRAVDSTTKCN